MTGAISASWNHRFINRSGTQVALNRSMAITANTTGADRTAPMRTRRERSAISACRSAAS